MLQLNPENLLNHLAAPYYKKDTSGKYISVNNEFLHDNHWDSDNFVIGQTDIDLWNGNAPLFQMNDYAVISQKKAGIFIEDIKIENHKRFYLSIKSPLFSKNGKILGLQGISIPLNSQHQIKLSDEINEYFQSLLYSPHTFSNKIKLSNRQKQCLHYLSRGMSAKKIGMVLNLSPKTIESYIAILKIKLECTTRNELIEKAFESGLIR